MQAISHFVCLQVFVIAAKVYEKCKGRPSFTLVRVHYDIFFQIRYDTFMSSRITQAAAMNNHVVKSILQEQSVSVLPHTYIKSTLQILPNLHIHQCDNTQVRSFDEFKNPKFQTELRENKIQAHAYIFITMD